MVELMLCVKSLSPLAHVYCSDADVARGPATYCKIFQVTIKKFFRQ